MELIWFWRLILYLNNKPVLTAEDYLSVLFALASLCMRCDPASYVSCCSLYVTEYLIYSICI